MGYDIILKDEAERSLHAMPTWLQKVVEDDLALLGKSPWSLSRTSVSPPHPPGFMVSEFSHGPVDGLTHQVAVFFRYSRDETKLIVAYIGHHT